MTTTTEPIYGDLDIDFTDFDESVETLRRYEGDTWASVLYAAADFVLAHGTPADHFSGAQLTEMQEHDPDLVTAWDVVAHWSQLRGDGLRSRPATFEDHLLDECEACVWLSDVLTHIVELNQEPCTRCARGIEGHDVAPDLADDGAENWLKSRRLCKEPWDRVREPLVEPPGTLGGYQVSEAVTARWVAQLVDGNYALIYRTYYRCRVDDGSLIIEREDWYVVASDPDNPKETKILENSETEDTESDDPEGEDLAALVDQSFDPELREWTTMMPEAAGFRYK